MKVIKIIQTVLVVIIVNISSAYAIPETTVTFNSPEKFTDFKLSTNLRLKDRERLMKQLTRLIKKSTNKILGNDYHLEITMNNIDMAGTFYYTSSYFSTLDIVRVVRESDRVRFEFSYRLFDVDGNLIKQDEVNLTSRNLKLLRPRNRIYLPYRHTYFTNEMPLFDSWLKEVR